MLPITDRLFMYITIEIWQKKTYLAFMSMATSSSAPTPPFSRAPKK
jgi:hypothetical protein